MKTPRQFDTGIIDARAAADPASAPLIAALRALGVAIVVAPAGATGGPGAPAPSTMAPGIAPPRIFFATPEIEAIRRAKEEGIAFVIGIAKGAEEGRADDGITDAGAKRTLRQAGADLVVHSLADLPLEEIEAWFANREHARPPIPARRDAIARRLSGRTPALFLDYDGTLTPIVARPELAVLAPEMRRTLSDLGRDFPTVIVSGRAREDVARLVGIEGLIYAGSHGFDIAGPEASTRWSGRAIRHEVAADLQPVIGRAAADLSATLAGIPGLLVEDKRFAVTVHFRQVAADRLAEIEAAVDRVRASSPGLKTTRGKKVLELRPAIEWDKGMAVLWLLEALDLEREEVVPIYLGDDTTDEDAFLALENRGLTALVARSPRPTAARYSLQDTDEVGDFLRFIASLGGSPGRAGMKLA